MNDKLQNKMDFSELLVILAYVFYISEEILNFTQFKKIIIWSTFRQLIMSTSAIMVGLAIALKIRASVKWFLLSLLVAIIGLGVMFTNTQFSQTAMLLLFIVAGNCLKTDQLFKCHWITVSTLVVFTLILYSIGVYSMDYFYKTANFENAIRYYLGFSYTTYAPNYFIHLILTFYTVRKKNIEIMDTVIFLLVNWILYKLTYTQAVYYDVILFIFTLWLFKWKPTLFNSKVARLMFTLSMPLLAVMSIAIAYIYTPTNPVMSFVDQLLSSRLSLAHQGITRYGLTLLGNPILWNGGRYGIERFDAYFYVDSSYVNAALTYGVIALFFVVVSFAKISFRAHKRGNIKLCIVIVFLAIHSFTDPQLFELKYDPFLLILFAAYIPDMENLLDIGNVPLKCTRKRKVRFVTHSPMRF